VTTAWHSSVRYSLKLSPVMPPIVAPTSLATILSVLSLLRVSSVTTVNATNEAMPVKSAAPTFDDSPLQWNAHAAALALWCGS
jgi:hypothetical protein